jgi:hypothetical protein
VSSPLAIAAVSAVLRNLLDDGVVAAAPGVGSVKVTAIAPDRVKLDEGDAPPSLNLFLHRVSPNPAWRNAGLPARGADGSRIANPPMALNLHYLLTAYGSADFQAEILLGYGMHVLHERPVLDRASIRTALNPSPLGSSILPPAFQALAASDLAEQVEAVTVTQEPMDSEEMSRLWSASQSHYRPSAAYLVSVVLIESAKPSRTPLPVLSRGPVDAATGRDRGVVVEPSLVPPFPTIERVDPPAGQPAARLGETLRLAGHHLDGTAVSVSFAHRLLAAPRTLTVGTNTDPAGIEVALPSGATAEQDWPAGVYTVAASLVRPGDATARETNVAALLLAPEPVLPPASVVRDAATRHVTVTLALRPQIRPQQTARLTLDGATVDAGARTAAVASLAFQFGDVPAGARWVRLTVDGVESLLLDRSSTPPAFDPTQVVTVPA